MTMQGSKGESIEEEEIEGGEKMISGYRKNGVFSHNISRRSKYL